MSGRTSEEPEQDAASTDRSNIRKRNRNKFHSLSNTIVRATYCGNSKDEKPKLIEALSQSAELYPNEIIDPVAYADRSIEERRQKSRKEGKIARPLNSYMLYRKAYQQVARRVLSNDQQQFASRIVGESWNRWEPKHVKAKFRDLAKTDHKKHHEAFPSYKYTPTQGRSAKQSAASTKASSLSPQTKHVEESHDLAFGGDSGIDLAGHSPEDGERMQPWTMDTSAGDWLTSMSGEPHSWSGIQGYPYADENEAYPEPQFGYASAEESLFVGDSFMPSGGDYWNDTFRNMTMSQCIDPSLLPHYEPADGRPLSGPPVSYQGASPHQRWSDSLSSGGLAPRSLYQPCSMAINPPLRQKGGLGEEVDS